jgi:cytochrome c biogenesis protein
MSRSVGSWTASATTAPPARSHPLDYAQRTTAARAPARFIDHLTGVPPIATTTLRTRRAPALGSPFARLGAAAWRTLVSVRFAVLLITLIAVAGVVGTVVRQFPAFALHDPAAYADELAEMHRRWDAITLLGVPIGASLVEAFDALGFFRVFSAPWFLLLVTVLVIAIVCCTLDRTPRLWRGVHVVTVQQPAAFFDPRLSDRALLEHASLAPGVLASILRRRRFRVRHAATPDGSVRWVYGDRNQYLKLATLLTHLGLILFLAGGAVTASIGFETVVFVGEGQTAPVRPVGTPDNLLVKVHSFAMPRREDGSPADFRTDLAVYRNGEEIARKVIRVNDPLEVDGFVFHQNTFGPSADVTIRDGAGALLWTGPVLLAGELLGLPQGFMTIPGSDTGLLLLLSRMDDGTGALVLQGIGPENGAGESRTVFQALVGLGATTDPADTGGFSITWDRAGAWTGMVIKNDPGQWFIWVAFLSLISGLVLTFYFPRRRVWARLEGERVGFAMLGDRYVDVPREFRSLLDDVAAVAGSRPVRA